MGSLTRMSQIADPVDFVAHLKATGGGAALLSQPDLAPPDAQPIPLLSLPELEAAAGLTKWLVKGVVPLESIGVVFGGSGTFKSFIALDLACHVAHGLPWLGRKTVRGPVVYIAAEGGAGMWRRVNAWHRARGRKTADCALWTVPVALDLGQDALRVLAAAETAGVTPSLVVIDTLSQTYSGEENSANEMAGYLRAIGRAFRDAWQCAVAIIHHSGHLATERPRGSSALRANTDWMLGVFRDEESMTATMECHKQKDGERFADVDFGLTQYVLGCDEDGDQITSLVARHLSSSEEVQDAMAAESKSGRGGHNRLILSLAHSGMRQAELQKAFYDACDVADPESRRKAYFRARKWAISKGYFDVAQGVVITTFGGGT